VIWNRRAGKIATDGKVKALDFSLAKAFAAAPARPPTATPNPDGYILIAELMML
jgi:hypothetical protein